MAFKSIKESSVTIYYHLSTGLRKERLNPSQAFIDVIRSEASDAYMVVLDAVSQERIVFTLINGEWQESASVMNAAA